MRAAVLLLALVTLITGLLACNKQETSLTVATTGGSTSFTPAAATTSLPPPTIPHVTIIPGKSSTTPVYTTPPLITTTLPATTTETTAPTPSNFKVVGYITHWHLNRLPDLKLQGLTHLIYQGIEITNSGDPTLQVANNAGWWQISNVVTAGHAANAKVLVSLIGQWDNSSMNTIWMSKDKRKQLINNLRELTVNYNLDGIDIDNENWTSDKSIYSTFVKELHDALAPLKKMITMAGSPYQVGINPEVYSYLDFVNVMTYDMSLGKGYPFHSTFEESVAAIQLWADKGMPKDKILIGVPLYGRDGNTSFYEYRRLVDQYKPKPDQDQVSETNASGGIIWWNGPDLAKKKAQFVKENGFGGVMLYELGTDTLDSTSILLSVYEVTANPSVTQPGSTPGNNSRLGVMVNQN